MEKLEAPITIGELIKLRHTDRKEYVSKLRQLVKDAKNDHTREYWRQMLLAEGEKL